MPTLSSWVSSLFPKDKPMTLMQADSLQTLLPQAIAPGLAMLPMKMNSQPAQVFMVAVKLQESGLEMIRQQDGGPAHGLWQFEQGGGVKGVLTHPASCGFAVQVCTERGVEASQPAVYAALLQDDILAAAFARLLMWTDPFPLPTDSDGALALYLRLWRPGAYSRDPDGIRQRWAQNYAMAINLVGASQ